MSEPASSPSEVLFPAPDAPAGTYKLDLKLGFRCNNRCTFCVQGDKRDYVSDLTTAEAIQRLEAARATCDGLLLTGGEITIRDDVPEIIRAATTIGARIIRQEGKLGTLKAGAYADLLLIDGDPLTNLNLIADPAKNFVVIMKDGKIYKNTLP